MNTILMSGAEYNSASEMDLTWSVSSSQKRTGSYSYQINYATSYYKTLPAAYNELVIGFGLYLGADPGTGNLFGWYKGSTGIVSLKFDGSGRLQVCSGWGGTAYFTGAQALSSGTWYYVELYFKMADSGGAIELRVDGVSQGTYSGDTKPGSDATIDKLRFYGPSGANSYIDDIMINTISPDLAGSWPNGAKIVLLKPNGDGSTKQWTPSAGSDHYAVVDEVPPSGTDYLQSATPGQVDELDIENLPAEALSIAAIQVDMWGLKGSTSPPTQVKLGVRIGGTNYMSSAKDLGLSQGLVSHILNVDPSDSNPFTPSDVNSLQMVLESV